MFLDSLFELASSAGSVKSAKSEIELSIAGVLHVDVARVAWESLPGAPGQG